MDDAMGNREKIAALLGDDLAQALDEAISQQVESREVSRSEWLASVAAVFMAPPLEAARYLTDHSEPATDVVRKLCEAVDIGCRRELSAELALVRKLSEVATSFTAFRIGKNAGMSGEKSLTERDEKDYLLRSDDMGDAKRRMKILAGLDIIRRGKEVSDLLASEEAQPLAYPLFAYFRSMIQFLFFEYYADGISVQMGRERGARKCKDRLGIRMLLSMATLANPRFRDKGSAAWRAIKKSLLASGLVTFDNEYAVEFQPDVHGQGVYSGHIVQTDPEGKRDPMSYEAFKPFFRQWKKEGDS